MKTLLLLFSVLFIELASVRSAQDEEPKPFNLTTVYGETYRGCRIIKVTPAAIVVAYDQGVAKIQFSLLNEEWKDLYNYDPAEARAYERSEQKARLAAEEKQQELKKKRDKEDVKMMKNLVELEKKQLEAQAERERRLAEEARIQAATSPQLAPLPGEAAQQQVASTQVVVPPVNTLGQPYTPSVNRSQIIVYPDGGYYVPPAGNVYVIPQGGYQIPYGSSNYNGSHHNHYGNSPYGFAPGFRSVPGSAGQITVSPPSIQIRR